MIKPSLPEAKKDRRSGPDAIVDKKIAVIPRTCPMFDETYAEKIKGYPIIKQKFQEFVTSKMRAPLEPYGAKDRGGVSGDPLRAVLPSIKHAHLTPDISVFYAISGGDPKYLDLFGIFTHDDVGQGQPIKPKVQQKVASRLKNQLPQLKQPKNG